jgi:hypothetical protein
MESLGIIELLGWYLVGFSATIGLLELLSKLNILKGKVKKTMYIKSSYNIST